jgi:hypothetical protein
MEDMPRQYALVTRYTMRFPNGEWQPTHNFGGITAEHPREAVEKLTRGEIDEVLPWDRISPDHEVTIDGVRRGPGRLTSPGSS